MGDLLSINMVVRNPFRVQLPIVILLRALVHIISGQRTLATRTHASSTSANLGEPLTVTQATPTVNAPTFSVL